MPNRTAFPFAISGQHRSDLGPVLLPGQTVVATLADRPRAQFTPAEQTTLASGGVRYQWGLGIGPNICNKLYVMDRAVQESFSISKLEVQFKENIRQSLSSECGEQGYAPSTTIYTGAELGVLVIERSANGQELSVRAYDLTGGAELTSGYMAPVPVHWQGQCGISLRGDNCFAHGVITV